MVRPGRDFDRLNSNLFRAFIAAAETLNFTRAARLVAMTQSGVSQQVAQLEKQLGVDLFTRVNRSVVLTSCGRRLVSYIEGYLDDLDTLCKELRGDESDLAGHVTYAMPGSCLFAPHLSLMLTQRAAHPDLDLRIHIRPNEEIIDALLSGELDFGFVTRALDVAGLEFVPFCNEEFILVSAAPLSSRQKFHRELLLSSPFVSYPGMCALFEAWERHHFPRAKTRCWEMLRVSGSIENIQGAIALASGGVGWAIVPRHCVQREIDEARLFELHPDPARLPLRNGVFIATLARRKANRRTKQVIKWFLDMHPEIDR